MSNSKDKIEEVMWSYIYRHRVLRVPFFALALLAIANTSWQLAKPTYEFSEEKINYFLGIKPKTETLITGKYAFWSGAFLHDAFNLTLNTDDALVNFFGSRHGLLRCFEVVGFKSGDLASLLDLENNSFHQRFMKNFELRERYEGYLEKNVESGLELFNSGYYLMALIAELQNPERSSNTIIHHRNNFVSNWNVAQENLNYRLPKVYISKSITNSEIVQPILMKKALSTLKNIREFYGSA